MHDQPSIEIRLTYLEDELRAVLGLIRVKEAITSPKVRGRFLLGLIGAGRSLDEVSAGQSLQYLGDNIDRARGHWIRALELIGQLEADGNITGPTVGLGHRLNYAGMHDVRPRLRHEEIPPKGADAASHLNETADIVAACAAIVTKTKTMATLARYRAEDAAGEGDA